MSEDKAFLVVNTIPNTDDKDSLKSYLPQIIGVFKQFGASNFQRFRTIEQIMGRGGIQAMAIVEFPSLDAIHQMYASEEFNSLNELRKKAYKQEVDLMICEAL